MTSHHRRSLATLRLVFTSAFVIAALSGCYGLFGSRRPGDSGLARKRVARKEPPTSLIALDNTRCLVSSDKYQRTVLGTEVTCYWQGSDQNRPIVASDDRSPARTRGSDADVAGKTDDMRVRQAKSKKPKAPSAP